VHIDPIFKANIDEGQRLRGWIANAYSQIEFLLDDLIVRCRLFPEYELETKKKLTNSAPERVRRVRNMLQMDGRLSPFTIELTSIIDRFEERRDTRNLLAHGLCSYLYTPAGDAVLEFKKWHRQDGRDDVFKQCFRLPDLASERDSLVALSDEAMRLFMRMHEYAGWVASPIVD
jgi:hypothetical protein